MDLRFLDVSEDFQRVELGDSKVPFPSEADRHVSKVGIIDGLFSTIFCNRDHYSPIEDD